MQGNMCRQNYIHGSMTRRNSNLNLLTSSQVLSNLILVFTRKISILVGYELKELYLLAIIV